VGLFKPNKLNMKKIILFTVMAMLCLNFWAKAQSNIMQLRVGDKLPKAIWDIPMEFYKNGQYTTETLSQYKGKIILLDFWASWCTNCIDALPKIKKLQETFGESIQVLLVNSTGSGETKAKIEHTYAMNSLVLKGLPTIINDSLFKKLIPRSVLPSYSFINSEGQLCGITTAEMINEVNIKGLMDRRLELAEMRRKSRELKKKGGN
jgi:thiol-disulfide isomerase/thioredoxin